MQAGDNRRVELQILAPTGVGFDVKIDTGETPARLSRHGGETAHASRQPEADAAGIGLGIVC
jgi:hypothetical protein